MFALMAQYGDQPKEYLPGCCSWEVSRLSDLFDFQASAFGETLFQFMQSQAKNAVHILSLNLIGVHAGDVKASGVGAVGALHADHFVFLVLFIDLGFALSPDPQRDIQHTLWEVHSTFCSDIFYGLNE